MAQRVSLNDTGRRGERAGLRQFAERARRVRRRDRGLSAAEQDRDDDRTRAPFSQNARKARPKQDGAAESIASVAQCGRARQTMKKER